MPNPLPLDTVRAMYAAFAANDRDALDALIASDVRWNQMPTFPGGGRWRGRATVFESVFTPFRAEWDGWHAQVNEYVAQADTVVALGVYKGVYRSTGKSVHAEFAHVYRVQDGRITQFDQYTDTAALQAAQRAD